MYEIGQIVYGLIEDKQALVPLKVIEEVTVKNIHQKKTNYKVLIPNEKQQKVDLEKFDYVFETLDNASTHLIDNAKKAIDDILLKTLTVEEKFFDAKKEDKIEESQVIDDACNNENNSVKIDLGDGIIGNISNDIIENITKKEVDIEKSSPA